jgi:anthranilate/para-aminobenzoate synthase component I
MTALFCIDKAAAIHRMNEWGAAGKPFFFLLDFENKMPIIMPLQNNRFRPPDEAMTDIFHWQISDTCLNDFKTNPLHNTLQMSLDDYHKSDNLFKNLQMNRNPLPCSEFADSMKKVQQSQLEGRSYLLNLCFRTEVNFNQQIPELYSIYNQINAPWKLHVNFRKLLNYINNLTDNDNQSDSFTNSEDSDIRSDLKSDKELKSSVNESIRKFAESTDEILVFSPERFIKIVCNKENAIISTYPMKGTIEADIPDAQNILLNDEKEKAEHRTAVDLLRNDLSKYARKVKVDRFRYTDRVETNRGPILQTSSQISGILPLQYAENIGDILFSMLPAGSVSGAPRLETVKIISETEKEERGYYTGVFGVFDGKNLDSAVMIRFLERSGKQFYFRSGCGITIYSDPDSEYSELLSKIYVPFI